MRHHLQKSDAHNPCPVCRFDGVSWDDLIDHYRSTEHRILCDGCDNGEGLIWDPRSRAYQDHLIEENVCKDCDRHFESASSLQNVSPPMLSLCSTGTDHSFEARTRSYGPLN